MKPYLIIKAPVLAFLRGAVAGRLAVLAALFAVAPAVAGAREWAAPQGCEIFMTVQAKACRVSNHYTCADDAPGDQWRADFDLDGLFFRSRIDFETQWIESIEGRRGGGPQLTQWLAPAPPDPASFSELIATGIDSFHFDLARSDGGTSTARGYDRLTGRSVTVDGVTLEETEFDFTETDPAGNVLRRARGREYINREMRLFFAGPGESDLGDGLWRPIDGSPLEFVFPGEPGFATSQPKYDCDPMTAGVPGAPLWRVSDGP
ncbi:hypothetical protein [Pseudogemmobacter sonorensis]|uniref:hypothetical protein n=1 Tax=Pseudogemmobacter sonorensis TaxID=2989681 RepID=UPI0036794AD0